MSVGKPQFLVDEHGEKTAVLLDIQDYEDMLRRISDLESRLKFDETVNFDAGLRDYIQLREELKKEGLLE